jgi:DNA-binding response OmpR family regulator
LDREKSYRASPSDPDSRAAPRSLRVVVADDDRDSVLTLMMLLREEGHEVRGVYAGRQVLAAVRALEPDVVILDIAMPDLSGWEVARLIRDRLPRRTMLIGVSGEYKHGVDRILSELVGFDHYLVKPYDPAALIRLIEPLRNSEANA